MTRAVRLAPAPPALHFGDRGQLRERIGESAQAHLDRDLPFLVLHRGGADELSRRVARNASAHLFWEAEDDAAAAMALERIADRLIDRFGRVLLVLLADAPVAPMAPNAPRLPPFRFKAASRHGADADRARAALDHALAAIRIDLRRAKVDDEPQEPALPPSLARLFDEDAPVDIVTLTIPPIDRAPDGTVYPQLRHDLSVAVGDAILRAACAYLDDRPGRAPAHYRALGRSAFLAAALKADKKLDSIARRFDFLLSVSPINTSDAASRFFADGAETPPRLRYRPLTVDPDVAKRDLYAIDLTPLEDPLLEGLFAEKRREIDMQLTMLATRNTPAFRSASTMMYGAPTPALVADALAILGSSRRDPPRGAMLGATAVAEAARDLIERYRALDERFDAGVEVRDDVAGLLVSNGRLMIGADTAIPKRRLTPLLSHEISVHLLSWCNGAVQGLSIFRSGLANYEGIQEGLGVFAEWAVGGLTRTRLRLLAGRVVAVDAMIAGAGFVDVYRQLHRDHGFTPRGAFGIAARVFRSGGLAKDAIYLQGFRDVMAHVAGDGSLDPYWLGKIAPTHLGAIEELLQRGLLRPPLFRPFFLDADDTKARITRWRETRDFETMLDQE